MSTMTHTALDVLTAVHPHHAETLAAHVEAMKAGTIVTVEKKPNLSYPGHGTFFTGVKPGDTVVMTRGVPHPSVQVLEGDAAHLAASGYDLPVVPVSEWTYQAAKAAQRAATKHAEAAKSQALVSATGWSSYSEPTEESRARALTHLDEAADHLRFAFAAGVLADYLIDSGWLARSAKMHGLS